MVEPSAPCDVDTSHADRHAAVEHGPGSPPDRNNELAGSRDVACAHRAPITVKRGQACQGASFCDFLCAWDSGNAKMCPAGLSVVRDNFSSDGTRCRLRPSRLSPAPAAAFLMSECDEAVAQIRFPADGQALATMSKVTPGRVRSSLEKTSLLRSGEIGRRALSQKKTAPKPIRILERGRATTAVRGVAPAHVEVLRAAVSFAIEKNPEGNGEQTHFPSQGHGCCAQVQGRGAVGC
jgi:hypothetical protein